MNTAESLQLLLGLPEPVLYLLLAAGAAIENIVPPVPADTFVVLGSFLAGLGSASAWGVAAVTWAGNVASAMFVYGLGYRYGLAFFERGWGRALLHPGQLERLAGFYARWGLLAIFGSRFLPGIRAVVPVFAGVARQPVLPVLLPLSIASAIWYGGLVWIGIQAARNLDRMLALFGGANRILLGIALAVGVVVVALWWRTRHTREGKKEETGIE